MNINFKPLDMNAEVGTYTRFVQQSWDWHHLTEELLRHELEHWPKEHFSLAGLLWREDQPVSTFRVVKEFWYPGHTARVSCCPDGLDPDVLQEGLSLGLHVAREQGFTILRHASMENLGFRNVIEGFGFRETLRSYASQCELASFTHSLKWADYEIVSYKELAIRRPETWEQDLHRLYNTIMKDVPLPDAWVDTPLDDYKTMLHEPNVRHEMMFVALDGEDLIGMSECLFGEPGADSISTGLTGVCREHRRRGVAWNLKVTALNAAKEAGVRWVTTDNEVNNPMYSLNERLGFRPFDTMIGYEREVGMA